MLHGLQCIRSSCVRLHEQHHMAAHMHTVTPHCCTHAHRHTTAAHMHTVTPHCCTHAHCHTTLLHTCTLSHHTAAHMHTVTPHCCTHAHHHTTLLHTCTPSHHTAAHMHTFTPIPHNPHIHTNPTQSTPSHQSLTIHTITHTLPSHRSGMNSVTYHFACRTLQCSQRR